jgi:hypothetical protein
VPLKTFTIEIICYYKAKTHRTSERKKAAGTLTPAKVGARGIVKMMEISGLLTRSD